MEPIVRDILKNAENNCQQSFSGKAPWGYGSPLMPMPIYVRERRSSRKHGPSMSYDENYARQITVFDLLDPEGLKAKFAQDDARRRAIIEEAERKRAEDEEHKKKSIYNGDSDAEPPKQKLIGQIFQDNLAWILQSNEFTQEQKKAASLIAACKTEVLGGYRTYCPNCNKEISVRFASCNNRNCPQCQFVNQEKWVRERMNEIIPGIPYYHITFTLPHELNDLILANETKLLNLLFRAASEAVMKMCDNPVHLGAKPGILSVLHTWRSDLGVHIHVHSLISGGGLDKDGNFVSVVDVRKKQHAKEDKDGHDTDRQSSDAIADATDNAEKADAIEGNEGNDFFLPLIPLSNLFRNIYIDEMYKLYKAHKLVLSSSSLDCLNDPREWSDFCTMLSKKDWVIHLEKTSPNAENVVNYFARYTFRTAISNSRIVSYDGKKVVFLVKDREKNKQKKLANSNDKKVEMKPLTIDVHEFIRRFLIHVLPKNFTRTRSYGFLANGQKAKNLNKIYMQLTGKPHPKSEFEGLKGLELVVKLFPDKDFCHCPFCGAKLRVIPFGDPEYERKQRQQIWAPVA